jgi:hypothetical protein
MSAEVIRLSILGNLDNFADPGRTQRADYLGSEEFVEEQLTEEFTTEGDPPSTAPRRQTVAGADLCKAGRKRNRPGVLRTRLSDP